MPPTTYTKNYIADDILCMTDEGQSLTSAAQKYGIPKTNYIIDFTAKEL
jgi:hypothetical protein